jgi:hypothetical protein
MEALMYGAELYCGSLGQICAEDMRSDETLIKRANIGFSGAVVEDTIEIYVTFAFSCNQ